MKIFCNIGNSVVDFAAAELVSYVSRLTGKKAKVVYGGGKPECGDVVLAQQIRVYIYFIIFGWAAIAVNIGNPFH